MMIRILKTSYGHPFYRANRSKNQRVIQIDKTALRKYENIAVRRQSTGRTHLVDRSNYLLETSMHTSTGRSPFVDRSNMLLESITHVSTGRSQNSDRSNHLLELSPHVSTGRRTPIDRSKSLDGREIFEGSYDHFPPTSYMDFDPNHDSSYASIASVAKGSFCKACSLSKLGLRPSYAKDIKETIPFLHRIQRDICRLIHPYCGLLR